VYTSVVVLYTSRCVQMTYLYTSRCVHFMILYTSRCVQWFVHIWCVHQMCTNQILYTSRCVQIIILYTSRCVQFHGFHDLYTSVYTSKCVHGLQTVYTSRCVHGHKVHQKLCFSSETNWTLLQRVLTVKLREGQAENRGLICRRGQRNQLYWSRKCPHTCKSRSVLSMSSSVSAYTGELL